METSDSSLASTVHTDLDMQSRLSNVRSRISAVCTEIGISQEFVRLVAVSKTKPSELILQALSAGQTYFGENYVDELVEKASLLPKSINWHFIGHLQSNKARSLIQNVPNLNVLESIDSSKLASKLNGILEEEKFIDRDPLKVFIQVRTSNEQSKSGVEVTECPDLAQHICEHCPRLRLMGLMTIGEEGNRDCFTLLSRTSQTVLHHLSVVCSSLHHIPSNFELSMGMSADFEDAIRCGSSNVRVGSVIFGERSRK